MLLFNNINNQDTNGFQNNQTYANQTMNQIVPDRSQASLRDPNNAYHASTNSTTKAQSKKLGKLGASKEYKRGIAAFNDISKSQESFIS